MCPWECVTGGVIRPAVTEGDGKGWLLSDQWPRAVPGAGGPRWGGSDGEREGEPGKAVAVIHSSLEDVRVRDGGRHAPRPAPCTSARRSQCWRPLLSCRRPTSQTPATPPTPPHPTKSKNCLSFYSHRKTSLNLSSLHNVHINSSKKYSGV